MEQLFMQIFDRKTWIEDQLRQQRDSYTQSLAFNLVANGDRPPRWLWTTGLDPSRYGDPKDLSREQMISEILFPTHQAIARSMSLSIMPDWGGHKDSQKNKCIKETCDLNNCFDVMDMNQACPSNVEAVSSCDVSGIQYSQLIQMQPEIQPAKRPKIVNIVEEEYNLDKFTGRLTRSMLVSAKSGCVKDSAESNKKLTCFQGENSVEVCVPITEASKLHICELSEPGKLLNLVEDGIKEDEETKITKNGTSVVDKSDNNNVVPQQFGEETDAACGVHRSWKMASPIASREPKITSFVAAMKSVKAKLACEDSEKSGRSSNGGSKEKFVLLESEDLEHGRCPASCNNKSSKLTSMMPSGIKFLSSGKKIVPLRSSPMMDSVLNTDSISYSEVGVANLQPVKSVKAKLVCEDSEKSERSANGGSKEKFVLLELEDFEHDRCPASCSNKYSKLTSMMPSGVKRPSSGKKIVSLRSSPMMDSVLNTDSTSYSEVDVANLQAVKSVKAKLPCEDSEKFDRSSNGVSKENFVLLEPEDSEHGRCPASCSNKYSKLTSMMPSGVKFPPSGKKIVPLRSSPVMDSVLNCSEGFSSHVSDLHEVSRRYSSGSLVQDQPENLCSQKMVKLLRSSVEFNKTEASSLIEPNNLLPYKFEETLHGSSVDASRKENQDTYFEKASSKLEAVQSLELGRPALLEREDLGFVTRATLGIVKLSPALASSSLSESVPSYTLPVSCVLNPVMDISDQVRVLPCDSKRELSEKLVVQDVEGSIGKIIEVITSSPLRPITNAHSDYSILCSSLKADAVSDSKETDAIGQKTPNFTNILKPLPEPTYFLRSSVGIDGNFSSLKRTGSLLHSSGDNDMRSEAQTDNTHADLEDFSQKKDLTPEMLIQTSRENHNEQSKRRYFLRSYAHNVTWPKRRKLENEPDHFLATYTRLRPKLLVNMQEGNDYIRKRSFENTSGDMLKFDMETKTLDASLDKNLEELHQSKKRHKKMADLCSKGKNQINNSSGELYLEDGNVNCCSKVKARIPESTALDSEDGRNILCEHEGAKISGYSKQFITETGIFPGECSLCTNDSARLSHDSHHDDNNLASCNETMPEFERFSIDIEDQIIFNESNNMIFDVHRSLPAGAGLWEHIKFSDPIQLDDVDKEQMRACKSGKYLNLHCHLGTAFDGSLSRRPHSYSASSKELGSNPEFTCFRIDENSSEENILVDEFDNASEEGVGLSGTHNSTNRKVLSDISSACQNAATLTSISEQNLERGRQDSVNIGSYFSNQVDVNPSLENKCITDNKENSAPLVSGGIIRNDAESIRSVSNRSETFRRANERNSSPFIPLIQKKQEAVAPLAGKRDIKVKALEIAEATKRLEEKKRNEREQQKAAAKIQRSRLEQEKARQVQIVQKQKEVTKHKKEVDLAARKRQREEQERKERERKRRCTEEARQQQRKQRRDTADDKEQRKKVFAKETKREMNLEKGKEISVAAGSWLGNNTIDTHKGSNDVKKVVCSTNALQKVIKDRMSVTNKSEDVSCSYLISPYQDSDYEDGMEDIRRKKKCIPLWARRESLEQGLLAMRDMDPAEIFSRKNSFNLTEVLTPRAHRAPLSLMR